MAAATGAGPRAAAWQVEIAVAVVAALAVAVEAGVEAAAGGRWVLAADLQKKRKQKSKIKLLKQQHFLHICSTIFRIEQKANFTDFE